MRLQYMIASVFLMLAIAAKAGDTVTLKSGEVSGLLNASGDVYIFKGIPYAEPPVGALRWREPQPVKSWAGVRKCNDFGPNAMQAPPHPQWAYGSEILIPADGKISEDCLYLNVWAPANSQGKKLPVMVVVHGGGFTAGSGSVAVLGGEELAKKGVVVVSINYRLGIFGFLAHPALSKESPHHVSGNYAILDQIAAFQWVKQNIAAFGGDPDNITADGGSAGSCTIHLMVGSPLAKGLFRRVISESGPLFKPNVCPHLKEAEAEGQAAMDRQNAHTADEMRDIPAEELLKDNPRREPVIDGYVLPDELINIFRQGKQNDVDLLIGYNEGDDGMEQAPLNASAFAAEVQKKFGENATAYQQIYPAANDEEAGQSQRHESRDLIFAYENYVWAKTQVSKGSNKAWFYYFNRAAPGRPYFGAFHGSQSAYAFHNLDKWNRPFVDWDTELSNEMRQYWVNFAATGNPNGTGLPNWPAFTASHTKVLQLGDDIHATELPAMKAFTFFDMDKQQSLR